MTFNTTGCLLKRLMLYYTGNVGGNLKESFYKLHVFKPLFPRIDYLPADVDENEIFNICHGVGD
jgi:hypothetical protein